MKGYIANKTNGDKIEEIIMKNEKNTDITFCEECGLGYPDNLESCPNCGTWKED